MADKKHVLTVRISLTELEAIETEAKKRYWSKGTLVRIALDEYLTRKADDSAHKAEA
jgi:hypothetical protein